MRRFPLLDQLRRPHGVLAPATGAILNVVNRPINRWAIDALAITGSEEVLDVGFGGGVGLALALRRLTSGRAAGIDISDEMVSAAARRFADDIRAGRLRVLRGDVAAIPFAEASFDRVYSVNTVFFWPDPAAGMTEIRRVLRPEGVAVIAAPVPAFVLARVAGLAPRAGARGPQQLRRLAEQAGFRDVRLRRRAGAALIMAWR